MSEQDTREQLEADIERYLSQAGCHEMVCGWLDRQAAITRRETLLENPLHNNPYVGLVRGKQWERKQASDYHCGKCGYPVTDHDSYCPECGGALHKASNKPNSRFDVLKTAENAENVTSKSEIRNFDDSREQLEVDMIKLCHMDMLQARPFFELLDRQAAITERKFWECYANGNQWEAHQYETRCMELTAERDKWKAKAEYQQEILDCDCRDIRDLQNEIDSLTAEREQYRENMLAQTRRVAELTAEVDSLREALDACGTGTMYELWRKDHARLEALRAAQRDKPGT